VSPISQTSEKNSSAMLHVKCQVKRSKFSRTCTTPEGNLPNIGLVSHPSLTYKTDVAGTTLSVYCPGVKVLNARLHLVRDSAAGGQLEIHRATWVMKCDEFYIIRVKFPLSQSQYELVFHASLPSAPDVLIKHPTKYHITTSDLCPNLLISLEHPLKDKFGFAYQSPYVQAHGIAVIAPMLYRLRTGFVYFSVQVNAEAYSQNGIDTSSASGGTRLFNHRLGLEKRNRDMAASMQRRKQSLGAHAAQDQSMNQPSVCVIKELHQRLQPALEPAVQEIQHSIHIDINVWQTVFGPTVGSPGVVVQRYTKRLHRRTDLPEFYERLLWFSDNDADCVVEMLLRFPQTQVEQYAPLKIGEWRLTRREEDFPAGF